MLIPSLPDRQPFHSRRMHWMNMLDLHATDRPDETAVTTESENISWLELQRRVQSMAADLRSNHSVSPGDRVIILALNSAEYLAAMVAINTVGAISVPVNIRSVPRELDYFISDSGAKVIYVDAMGANTLAGAEYKDQVQAISLDRKSVV